MNHIYKVVWSKVKNCYVVVSEIAHNSGKEHSSRTNHSHRKGSQGGLYALALAIALGLTSPSQADAADLGNKASATYDTNGNLVVGNEGTVAEGTKQVGKNNTTIGTDSDTLRNVTEGDTKTSGQPMDTDDHTKLVDEEGKAHSLDDYKSTEAGGSTAVGYKNHNEGDRSTTIGNTAKVTNKPVTYYVDADGNKTASQDDAAWYKDSSGNPTKVPQVFRDSNGNTTTTTQYIHTTTTTDDSGQTVTKTEITTDKSLADKNSDGTPVYSYQASDNTDHLYTVTLYQASQNSIAAGTEVTANGSNAVVIGYNSTADNSAVAIGDTAAAKENGVAIGKNTKANVEGSIALGKGSEANRTGGITGWDPKTGATSTQIGLAWKSTEGALSIGNGSASRQITGVAAGSEDTDAVNLAQLKNAMTHYYSVKTTADTDAAGNNNYLNDGATGDNALAAGVTAKASGDNSTAVGYNTSAAGTGATAIGNGSKVTNGGVAVGNGATASGDGAAFGTTGVTASSGGLAVGMYGTNASSNSAAFGLNSTSATNRSVAVGTDGTRASNSSVAVGSTATANNSSFAAGLNSKAGTNGNSSNGSNIAVGSNTTADNGSTAFGINAKADSHSLAIGLSGNSSNVASASNYSIAVGNAATANYNTYSAIAIGNSANASSYQAMALGTSANATNYQSMAIGSSAAAHGSEALAMGNGATANSNYDIAIGSGALAQSENATALGYKAKADAPNSTALGSGASASYHAIAIGASTASSSYALAAGDGAQANVNDGIALGSHATVYRKSGQEGLDTVTGALSSSTDPAWKSTYGALSIGNISSDGTVNGTRQITGVAAGSQDTDAVNVAQLKAALKQTGTGTIHDYSVNSADTTKDTNYNYDADTGSNALAAGVSAKATGVRSVAVGNGAKAQGADSIAIGTNAVATGQGAMVIGQYNTAEGQNSLAFGGGYNAANKGNKASSTAAVAFGEGSWAVSEGSVAFGYGTQAGNTIKDSKGNYTGQNAVAFGNGTKALGGRSLAFGENTTANYNDSVAFGNGATAYSTGTVAFGNRSRALSQYATSFGDNSVAAGSMSFAFGTDNIAGAALDDNGALELTDGSRMDSYGNKAYTTTDAAGKTITYSIKGMGIPSGGDTHDYVVVTGTKADGTTGTYVEDYQGGIAEVKVNADGTVTKVKDLYSGKYGGWYQYDEQGNIIQTGTGKNKKPAVVSSDTLKAQNKPIPVTLDKATPGSNGYTLNGFKNATAFGYSTEASGDNATAFGNDTKAKAAAATAFGTTTTASGVNATAFGLSTTASGDNATAFGEGSTASGEAATAFGISSNASGKNSLAALGGTASAENAAAIGNGAQAKLANSVALGSGAVADRESGAKGYDMLTKAETTNTSTAWVSNANAIAVGNGSTLTRQITGVAAGSLDTDAVNVAQLKAAGFKVTTQNNGDISSSILNGDTLDFEGKDNAIVSTSKDSKTINVAVSKTPTFDSATFGTTNNEKVTIANGHISTYNKDQQERAVLGTDNQGSGTLHLVNNDLSQVHLYTQKANDDNGVNDGVTRMWYTASSDGEGTGIHTIAVLDDGINYVGDNYTDDKKTNKVVVKHKLNSTMDITGGADTSNLSDNNIGVVATPAVEDDKGKVTQRGKLEIKLNKNLNLTEKGSVEMGDTTINNGGVTINPNGDKTNPISLTENGLNNGGKTITNVAKGTNDNDAVNVSQLNAAKTTVKSSDNSISVTADPNGTPNYAYDIKVATATLSNQADGKVSVTNPNNNANSYATGNSVADAINNSGFKLTASASEGTVTDNKETLIHPGDTVTIDAGKNISLTQDKGKISIATKDKLNLGSADSKDDKQQDVPGVDGSITVNGKNGSAVAINGKDGSIGLTGPKGTDGKSTSIQMSTIMSTSTLDDGKNIKTITGEGGQQTTTTQAPRIQYKNGNTTYEVATMDDGQKYAGDVQASDAKANAFSRKLNEQINVVGGVTNLDDLSKANNVGVVSNGTDTLTIRLAKKLTDLTSVTTVTTDAKGNKTSETVQNGNGITITPSTLGAGKSYVSLTDKGLSNGGNQITHVDSGLKDAANNLVDLATANGDVLNNAVNVGDLKNVASAHTAVTVNGENEAPDAGANGNLGKYTDKEKGNLLLAQKKDKNGKITYDLKLNDNVILGKDTSDGKDGQEGTIGLTGKDGVPGTDGKQGYSTTIIKTEKGQKGADGKTSKENLGGTDITRIVYTDKDGSNPQTVATLSDGLKFAGDDISKTVDKKLNETLQIRGDGTYDTTTQKTKEDGNIQVSADTDTGTIKVALNKDINLKQNGSLTVGGDTQDGSITVQDPIIIKHFDAGKLTVTGTDKNGNTPQSKPGDYVTGLDNKDWDVTNPTYVSGRAATEDQLKAISDAVNKAASTAGEHTVVTVNDKDSSETTASVGTNGKYGSYSDSTKGNLLIASKDENGKTTYNIKLNDQLAIGQKGEKGESGKPGTPGKDGKVTVETKGGTTVVVGHNGADGENGKDGLFVTGKDGKDGKSGVSITGPDGIAGKDGVDGKVGIAGEDGKDAVSISGTGGVGHIGLTGPKGEKGADGTPGKDGISIDITTDLKSATLDDGKNVKTVIKDKDGKETTITQAPRIQYDSNGKNYEVATMDDGLKIGANAASKEKAANPVSNKLNSTINIMGSAAKTGHTYTDDNLTTTVEQDKDGNTTVKVLMDKDITGNSVTVGEKGESGTPGKDGVDGTIGVNGKDGSSVVIKGQDGISINGKDGQNGVTIKGVDGKAGMEGHIGLIGPKGPKGADGKDGQNASADIHVKNGQVGVDGTDGNKGTNGMDRVVYEDHNHVTHEVATMDDGLKFAGDDVNTTVAKKLNSTLQIRGDGTYDKEKNTVADDGNIKTSVDNGAVKVSLSDKINLHQDGYLTVGGDKNGDAADGNDPILIKHFDDKTLDVITGVDKEGKPIIAKVNKAGDYVTGLDNKNWNVDKPEYVSGRAATEDQLKTISDAVKEAATTAGKHTVITVENGKAAGTTDYNGENLKLKVMDEDGQKTYDLKLNDKVTLGKDGVDGSVGLKGADGKSSIGLNGKDGISVIGTDGKNGVSITGSNGLDGKDGIDGKIAIGTPGKDAVSISGQNGEGHIGLTGSAGKDGKDASADIHVKNGQVGVDGTDGHGGKDGMDRVVYEDHNHITHEVATMDDGMKYAGDFGKGASVKLNKTVNVKGNAKKEADLTDGNIGVVSSQSGDNGQLLIKLNKDLNLGNNGSVKMGNTTINNDGMTISKTESGKTTTVTLTDKGLDNGGNKITNVANGEISATSKDAVNGSQLNAVKTLASQHTTVEAGPSGNVTVTPGTNTDGSKKYTVDIAKDVTFGDAAKGDKTVAISGTDGKVTAGTGDNKVTVDGSKGQIVAGGDNGVKIGKIADGDGSLTIYDKDGKATGKTDKAGKYVTNLDNKTWNQDGSYVSGRAATEDQLHQVESNVNKQIADVNTKIDTVDKHHTEVTVNGGTAAKADGSYTDGNLQIAQKTGADGQKVYDLKLNDNLNIGGVGKDGKDGKDGHVGINGKDGKSGVGIDGKDGISVKGKDGQNGVTIKGVDGKDGTEGHIGLVGPKGPKGADGKDGKNASADIYVKNGQVGVDGTDGHGGKDGMDRVVYEDHNGTSHEVATMDDGMKYSGDSGSAAVKLNNNVQLYGGAKEYAAGDNIGVIVSQDGDNAKMQVKLAKDLKGIDSIDAKTVTTGNTTINNGGLTVKGDDKHKDITVQQGSVNMGGNKIEGVAPGKVAPDSTEAVNGSQLAQRDQAIGKLGGEVSSLDRRVDRVGAGAAALAALHPQDFDPDDKWDFAVGYGNYRGANAAAVGAFYRPNEDTTLSVGGTVGGGENMVNAGISFKFGQGNHVTNSRVAMAKEILALKDYVQKQDEKIEKLEALVGQQGTAAAPKRRSILFPDVPENHWAYVYVKKLADRGLLEGYPDGEFKGDRTITRYEFAAIFSRALENGASVDGDMERMSEEFEPEIRELSLNRFRVDRVEGKDNDRHKIERVRVNDRDELVQQKNGEQKKRYRDLYGSVIEKDAPSDAAK